MFTRNFWIRRLEQAFGPDRRLVWLSGVRRVGKTQLCRGLEGWTYLDCELPSVRRDLEDPERFLKGHASGSLVLDEVHRLPDPAQWLKVATDHFPGVRVVATGSSTLEATARFRDTLAGRKRQLWMTPMNSADLGDFGGSMEQRLFRGGLPGFFLEAAPEADYQEWLQAFWARGIQELFRVEKRAGFLRLVELLMLRSGGLLDLTRLGRDSELSRQTAANYVALLEATHAVQLLRPFSGGSSREIVSMPKAYAFDTGFVWHVRGYREPRDEDRGLLWEHYVLNELNARLPGLPLRYWRTKQGLEVDFVTAFKNAPPVAVECKWSASDRELPGLRSFLTAHPNAVGAVVSPDRERALPPGRQPWHELGLEGLIRLLESQAGSPL